MLPNVSRSMVARATGVLTPICVGPVDQSFDVGLDVGKYLPDFGHGKQNGPVLLNVGLLSDAHAVFSEDSKIWCSHDLPRRRILRRQFQLMVTAR
jgi:hypothetical protein